MYASGCKSDLHILGGYLFRFRQARGAYPQSLRELAEFASASDGIAPDMRCSLAGGEYAYMPPPAAWSGDWVCAQCPSPVHTCTESGEPKGRIALMLLQRGAYHVSFAVEGDPVSRTEPEGDEDQSSLWSSSCANHAIRLWVMLLQYTRTRFTAFPKTEDTREALLEVDRRMAQAAGEDFGTDRADHYSQGCSACPESYRADKSIGYVWVGAGLPTKLVEDARPLLLFCPASSHQGTSQHCHAIRGWSTLCVGSNAEMVEILKKELERAAKKEIPYTEAAVKKMRDQLALRQQYEQRRLAESGRSKDAPDDTK